MGSTKQGTSVEIFLTEDEYDLIETRSSKGGEKICTLKAGLIVPDKDFFKGLLIEVLSDPVCAEEVCDLLPTKITEVN